MEIKPISLYVILRNPINRHEKRIAQKEYESISKELLPIFKVYEETFKENLNKDKSFVNDIFIKKCKELNKGKVFIAANPKSFFISFGDTKEEKEEKQLGEKMVEETKKDYALILFLFISIIVFLIFYLRK